MEKVRFRLYQLTLLLTLISLALVLVSSGKQREFFYIAVYGSIIGLLLEYKKVKLRPFSIAFPVLLIGLLNLAWYFAWEYHNEGINTFSDYFGASKKLILGSFLIFYLDRFKTWIPQDKFKPAFVYATGIGFLLATLFAIWQSTQGMGRVEMAINRPTVSAYVYSVLSMAFIYGLYLRKTLAAYILAGAVILLSYIIIIMTGTRSAMGLYIVIAVVMTLYHFKKIHVKSSCIFLCIVAIIVALGYKPYIEPKLNQTTTEIADYQQGKDNTSLGARFSMWTVGIANGAAHPLGQSMESRQQWTGKYVESHPHLKTSMQYINVHLHNEIVEKYSLQGIPGVILTLFFFVALLAQAIRKENGLLLIATLFLLLYGFTDVLLLSSEAVIFYLTIFALCPSLSRRQLPEN